MNGVDRNAAPLFSRRCGSKAGSATYRRRDAVAAKSRAFWFGARGPCEGGGGVHDGGGYRGAAREAAADDAAVRKEAGPSRRLCRRLLALSICATLVNNIRLVYFKVMCYNVFIGETRCTYTHRASRASDRATCAGRAARAGLTSACGLIVARGVWITVPGQPRAERVLKYWGIPTGRESHFPASPLTVNSAETPKWRVRF